MTDNQPDMPDDLKQFAEDCLDAHEYGSLEYRLALAYLARAELSRPEPSDAARKEASPIDVYWGANTKPFPVQKFGKIPWFMGQTAWAAYTNKWGTGQSCERIAERGGFGVGEMDTLYPYWRKHLAEFHARVAALSAPSPMTVPDKVREALFKIANMRIEVYRIDCDAMKSTAKEALAILDQQAAAPSVDVEQERAALAWVRAQAAALTGEDTKDWGSFYCTRAISAYLSAQHVPGRITKEMSHAGVKELLRLQELGASNGVIADSIYYEMYSKQGKSAPQQVPTGWKMVPIEPTPKKISAAISSYRGLTKSLHEYLDKWKSTAAHGAAFHGIGEVYKAMLSAAPQADKGVT